MTQTGAFLATLAIELPVVLAAVALLDPSRRSLRALARLTLVVLAANALTHPLLWMADARLAPMLDLSARWALLEVAVVLAEASALTFAAGLRVRVAVGVALLANAISFVAGLLAA